MTVLPVGTLTFVLTDLEGSTRSWDVREHDMRAAMLIHDEILYGAVGRHDGVMVESGRAGDSILAVFRAANDAAASALEIQRAFRAAAWPPALAQRIRIALHTGEVELRAGHYFGPPLNRCARVLALCHPGQTLLTHATRDLLAEGLPSDLELMDLGVHRLKDIRRSEQIYQLTDPTRRESFPPLSASPLYRTNLPFALTSFVGRDRELTELRELQRSSRLLTLTGPGGSGKTRLALELARAVTSDMAGGVWLVDLAPLSDAGHVAPAIARALEVEEQQGRSLLETLTDRCRAAPMLLVFDSCEHLLEECARIAEALLTSTPDLSIVVTSREPLNIGGETVWRIPPLSRSEAATLFIDRSRARAGRSPAASYGSVSIDEICRSLDGIPLAIELAAARTATMDLEEIRRRLARDLTVLTGGNRTASPRQRTLEAAIDWSYDLLSERERALMRRVAIFAGPFTLGSAETVCADGMPAAEIVDLLGQLVSKSLLQITADRYGCLETIRAYGRAKLAASGELDAVRRAHVRQFAAVAASRRAGSLAAWLDLVEEEHADLREALAWAIGADPDLAAGLAADLYEFWLRRGHTLEARGYLDRIAAVLAPTSPHRARVLIGSGAFAYTAGDFEAAARVLDEGLDLARRTLDEDLIAKGLVLRGNVALAVGAVDAAGAALSESLSIAQRSGNERREAEALHHLGTRALVREDRQLAIDLFTRSLELRRAAGVPDETATTLMLRSFVRLLRSEVPGARADIVGSLRIAQALRDRRAAWSLAVLSCIEALEGDAATAVRLAAAASAAFDATAQHPPPDWRRLTQPIIERARAKLGEQAAEAAWSAGRSLDIDVAVEEALAAARDAPLGEG